MPDAKRSRLPYALVVLAATVGVAIGLGVALLRSSHVPAAESAAPEHALVSWAAGARHAPPLALHDQTGALVSLRSLRGHVVLLTFLDSRCRRECPVEGRTLADVQRRIAGSGATLAVVSVDPWADTAQSARAFAARDRWHGDWHWLLGSERNLIPVWHAYNIAVKRTPGDILHATALYVIDTHGDLRAGYLFPFAPGAVARDVQRLST